MLTVGIPIEIKETESRVSSSPHRCGEFVKRGCKVIVQHDAGASAGFGSEEYKEVGCELVESLEEVYAEADLIYKVKAPQACEIDMMRDNQIIFSFLHLSSDWKLCSSLKTSNAICLSYETLQANGQLPILMPMSKIAGKMSVFEGLKLIQLRNTANYMKGGFKCKNDTNRLRLRNHNVLIIGGGNVGSEAAKVASDLGAKVVVLDINKIRLCELGRILPSNVRCLYNTDQCLFDCLQTADIVIGSVLDPGARAPILVKAEYLKSMKKSIILDVSVDQGGCFETCIPTTLQEPVYDINGVIHYCVPNMPSHVPCISSEALSDASFPYALNIATYGLPGACEINNDIASSVNVYKGHIVSPVIANSLHMEYTDLSSVFTDYHNC